jgi:hypothetical protein
MGYDRIRQMHAAGDHARCRFGCCPENQAPSEGIDFESDRIKASRELAARVGRDDPRIALALDAREFLDTSPVLPGLVLAQLDCFAAMADDLSGEQPDGLDLLKVRRGRRMLDDANRANN